MKIYIATAWDAREHARRIADACAALGHTITRRWWEEDSARYATDERYRRMSARRDRDAVFRADVVVLLTHPKAYGAMVELGMAIRGGVRVIVAHGITHEGDIRDCIFYHLPDILEVVGETELMEELAS